MAISSRIRGMLEPRAEILSDVDLEKWIFCCKAMGILLRSCSEDENNAKDEPTVNGAEGQDDKSMPTPAAPHFDSNISQPLELSVSIG